MSDDNNKRVVDGWALTAISMAFMSLSFSLTNESVDQATRPAIETFNLSSLCTSTSTVQATPVKDGCVFTPA